MATVPTRTTRRRIALLSVLVPLAYAAVVHVLISEEILQMPISLTDPAFYLLAFASVQLCAGLCGVWLLYCNQRAVNKLQQSIRKLIKSDFSAHLNPDEHYGVQRLANQVNRLIDLIDESKETRRSLAEFDSLILSGADITAIIRRCLIAARLDAVKTTLLLRSETDLLQIMRHSLNGVKVITEPVSISEMDHDVLSDAEFYRQLACNEADNVQASHPIACDDQFTGVLVASGHRPLTASESKRLSDLVDRLSVAMTNIKRSETLYRQAHFDALTGLINRRAFEERLQESLLRSKRGETGVILFLDLDGFKKVNDTGGHEASDRLLVIIGKRLRGALRPEDTIARLGGDEFAVIATDCADEKSISDLCDRIVNAVTAPVFVDRMEHVVGTSIGIARYPDDGQDLDELLMKADSAMYKAKETGGSRFAFFDDSLKAANNHRLLVESRLRSAIKERNLELHFQPKLNLKEWTIDDAEALLRWDDEELGTVSPDEFIGIAEESGLITEVMPIIIERSSLLLDLAEARGVDIDTIAINASPRQIMTDGFALSVLSMLDAHGIAHRKFEVEVTESVFAQDMAQVMTELHILRMAGIRIALDDFGTGYSSLNMLRELPLDVVKIDRAFITEIETSEQARAMLKHLIDIANALGLKVVAEGVETESQIQYLIDHDCDFVQGWLISRALPDDALLDTMLAWPGDARFAGLPKPKLKAVN